MRRALSFAPPALAAAAMAAGAVVSWRRLGSLVLDTGRELEVARRIAEGEVLYRDVRYYWGPLAPWVNGALFSAFGAHADVLIWTGLAVAALTAGALYVLARDFAGRWVAASVVVMFAFCGAFARLNADIFNFVLPFNFSATYGIAAAAWSLALLVRHCETGRPAWLHASVALAALAWLAKLEVAVAVTAAHGAFVVLGPREGRARRAVAYAAALLAIAAVYGSLRVAVGPDLWRENLFKLLNDASRVYIRETMGTDDVAASIVDVAVSSAFLAALSGVTWAASAYARRRTSAQAIAGASAIAGLAALAAFAIVEPQFALRATPVALAGAIAAELVAWLRSFREGTERRLAAIVVLAFGLAILQRIVLQAGPRAYGFYLFPVAFVALVLSAVRSPLGAHPVGGKVVRSAAAGAALGLALFGVRTSWDRLSDARTLVEAPRATLYLDAFEARALEAIRRLPPRTRVLALPDGAGLVFASGLSTPRAPVLTYVTMVLPDEASVRSVLSDWSADPPEVIVWGWLYPTHGAGGFGIGHGARLREWIEANYRPLNSTREAYVLLARN